MALALWSQTQIVPPNAPASPCVVTSSGAVPIVLNSAVREVTAVPAELSWTRYSVLSKLAASRLPLIAPPKFDAVYIARPFVDAPNTLSAPLAAPGNLYRPSMGSAEPPGDGGWGGLNVLLGSAREGSGCPP